MVGRWVNMKDEVDPIDMNTSSGNVGSYECVDASIAERFQCACSRTLCFSAVQSLGVDPEERQLVGEAIGAMFGARKDERAPVRLAISLTTAILWFLSTSMMW